MSSIRYKYRHRFSSSGIKIGIDFQTLVPSWYIDGSNFCFESRYKSNQDFGAPAAPPYPNVHGMNPPERKLTKWCAKWRIKLNPEKTKVIIFSR